MTEFVYRHRDRHSVQVLHIILTVIGDANEINRNDDCSERCIAVREHDLTGLCGSDQACQDDLRRVCHAR
jgi:hypothetical protein